MSNKKITKTNKISATKAPKIKGSKKETLHPQQTLIDQLISWGLNQNEALVYVYLLERGTEVGGSKIAVGTKLHRQYVYKALETLIKLGLSESVLHGKLSKYKALSPNNIEKIAKRKALEAGDLSHNLNKISKVNFEQEFEAVIGEENYRQYEIERSLEIEEGSSQYIIGDSSDKYLYVMQEAYDEYAKNLHKRKIKTYYLDGGKPLDIYKNLSNKQHFDRRELPPVSLEYFSMVICNDRISFYGNVEPVSIYTIKSKKIAESYKRFFMMLWGMCGEGKAN